MTVEDLVGQFKREGRIVLTLRVAPKSPKTAWAGRMEDGSWKVRLAAVAEDGKANAELVRFLARELGVERDEVNIVSGAAARMKQVRIGR